MVPTSGTIEKINGRTQRLAAGRAPPSPPPRILDDELPSNKTGTFPNKIIKTTFGNARIWHMVGRTVLCSTSCCGSRFWPNFFLSVTTSRRSVAIAISLIPILLLKQRLTVSFSGEFLGIPWAGLPVTMAFVRRAQYSPNVRSPLARPPLPYVCCVAFVLFAFNPFRGGWA